MVHCASWERFSETFDDVGGVSDDSLISRVLSMHNGLTDSRRLESVLGVELPVLRVLLWERIV